MKSAHSTSDGPPTSTSDAPPPCPSETAIIVPSPETLRGLVDQSSSSGSLTRTRPKAARFSATLTAQCILRIAGDPLVAFGQCDQLVAADNVVDRVKRPVVSALIYFAQDCVGRIAAVGQNDARRRLKALLLIGGERGNRGAALQQRRSKRPRIQKPLAGAVGAARHHRVGGVA